MTRDPISNQTRGEEIANSITHGIGIGLSITCLVLLVVFASIKGDAWKVVSFSIYGASLIILYTVSTLYHSFKSYRVKRIFQVLDHSAIFILIAGTYTPIMLVNMRGPWGWSLFGVTWGLAILGIIIKSTGSGKSEIFTVTIYVLMGWIIVIAFHEFIASFAFMGIMWILIGGICYTVGVVFFFWESIPYSHPIFHLFVLAGSIMHFFGMLFHVLPAK